MSTNKFTRAIYYTLDELVVRYLLLAYKINKTSFDRGLFC